MQSRTAFIDLMMTRAQVGDGTDVPGWLARLADHQGQWIRHDGWDERLAWSLWFSYVSGYADQDQHRAGQALDGLQAEIDGHQRPDWDALVAVSRLAVAPIDAQAGLIDTLAIGMVQIEELAALRPDNVDPIVLVYALNGAIITLMRSALHRAALRWQRELRELSGRVGSERLIGVSRLNEAESLLDLALMAAAQHRDGATVAAMVGDARALYRQGRNRLIDLGLLGHHDSAMSRYGTAIDAIAEPTPAHVAAALAASANAIRQGDWDAAAALVAAVVLGAGGDEQQRREAYEQSVAIFASVTRMSGALIFLLEDLGMRHLADGVTPTALAGATAAQMGVRIRSAAVQHAAGAFDERLEAARNVLRAQHTAGLALRDPLTGLGNRRALHDRISAAIEYCAVDGRQTALAYLDLDDFKKVNDTLSHQGGDAVLHTFATSLSSRFASADALYRHGGDEFVLMLDGFGPERAQQVVTMALRSVAADTVHLVPDGVRATVGITAVRADDDVAAVLHRADLASLRAKRSGKGAVVVTDEHDPLVLPGSQDRGSRGDPSDPPSLAALWNPPPAP